MLATQKVNRILSQFEEPQRATRSTKIVRAYQYAPTKFFISVSYNFNTEICN